MRPRNAVVADTSASTNTARDEICPSCKGKGHVYKWIFRQDECSHCKGTGKLSPIA